MAGLSTQQQMLVEQRVTNASPSVAVAYLLWFFLGLVGGHRFYLGRVGSAFGMILATACFLIPGAIWALVDAFLIPGMIRQKQDQIRRDVQLELLSMGGEGAPAAAAAPAPTVS